MTGVSPLRLLLACLLAIIVGGSGPIVFAAMPRAFNANAEEETRTVDVTVGGSLASGIRVARGREGRLARQHARRLQTITASGSLRIEPAVAFLSLHALAMRIQV